MIRPSVEKTLNKNLNAKVKENGCPVDDACESHYENDATPEKVVFVIDILRIWMDSGVDNAPSHVKRELH